MPRKLRIPTWQGYVEALQLVAANVDYNYNVTQYNQEYDPTRHTLNCATGGGGDQLISNGQSWTMADPAAWYYMHTGDSKYRDQMKTYIDSGLNGGATPYNTGGSLTNWTGNWAGRWSSWVYNNSKSNATPPSTIANLSTTANGQNINLHWTAPQTASRYIVAYSNTPFYQYL